MSQIGATMGEAFTTLMTHAQATGAEIIGPPFSLYPEVPQEEVLFRVALPVAQGAVSGDGVTLEDLPGGEAATLLYRGPYDAMGQSWERLLEWVGASGRQPGGAMREIYLNDPEAVPPADLLTQLVVPLA
jgi:effector-binding domain-containing protein